MNSTCARRPVCGTKPIGTAELHDFDDGIHWCSEHIGSATSEVSDIAWRVEIYNNSDRISRSMGSQRHTRFIVPKGLDLYRVKKLRPLIEDVKKNLPATSGYCPENKYIFRTEILLTATILQLIVSVSKTTG
jgi:hypothetical protein